MNSIQNYEIEKVLRLTISDSIIKVIHQLTFLLVFSTYWILREFWFFDIDDQVGVNID